MDRPAFNLLDIAKLLMTKEQLEAVEAMTLEEKQKLLTGLEKLYYRKPKQ